MRLLEGQVRIPSGCAVSAVISREGRRMSGQSVIESMKPMHDRSNGLGGGFAGYGIYPEYRDLFALHLFFRDNSCRKTCEAFLKERFDVVWAEEIPVRKMPQITDEPLIWRYFASPLRSALRAMQVDEKEFVVRAAMRINQELTGAHVFSCGKNMGVFKGVGYPEDMGNFTAWGSTGATAGPLMDAIPPTRRGGGVARIPSPCWITRWSITERSPPMTPTAALWRCLAINAHFRRTQRLSPICWTTFCAARD